MQSDSSGGSFFSWSHWLNPFIERLESGNRMFRFRVVSYNAESAEENRTSVMSTWGSGLLPVRPTPSPVLPKKLQRRTKH